MSELVFGKVGTEPVHDHNCECARTDSYAASFEDGLKRVLGDRYGADDGTDESIQSLSDILDSIPPDSRAEALARTKIEEAIFWLTQVKR